MELTESNLKTRAKTIQKKLTACRKVKKLVTDKPWQEIVQPLLDAMIEDVVGGKADNMYKNGHLCKPAEHYEYFTGYKQALMDFNNRIWNYVNSIEALKGQFKGIEKQVLGKETYTNPMLDSKYAPKEAK